MNYSHSRTARRVGANRAGHDGTNSARWFTSYETLAALPDRTALITDLTTALDAASEHVIHVLVVDVGERSGAHKSHSPHFRDEALVRIARILGSVVPGENLVYRVGDSRFAVALENASDNHSGAIATRLIAKVDQATTGPRQLRVDVGISTTENQKSVAEELLRQAEAAAMAPQPSAQDQWSHYSPHVKAPHAGTNITADRLAQAVDRNEFSLLFQGIFDAQDLSWRGAEALIRRNAPDFGTVLPGDFLPFAEKTGLLSPITRSVLPELGTFAHKARKLSQRDDFFISLNASQTQLRDTAFSSDLRRDLATAAFPFANLVIEVTEDFSPLEPDRMTACTDQLGTRDARFALDDFGRGNWSLDHLWRLPFSFLKLDRRLIANIVKSPDDRKLLEELLVLAGEHELRTIAEGVETVEQVELLARMGVDDLQGYQLSMPLTATESLDLITAAAA